MTALDQYRRLEATGLWHESPEDQRREVVVALGDATLMISTLSDTALTHWSLPAVLRLNPGKRPAIYAPGPDGDERLEIDDPNMIEAIEKLRSAIERRRPHPGRLRLMTGLGLGVIALALLAFWLPSALTRQTVAMLPDASRSAIGQTLLTEITRLAGRPCTAPSGRSALDRLAARSFDSAPRVVILPSSIPETLALPGGTLIANAALVEDYETPEVLAGFLLAEDLRSRTEDPMLQLLESAGLRATFRLLTTGQLPQEVAHNHAATLLSQPRPAVEDAAMIARFATAEISSQPYAFARDVSGETVLGLIEADPMRNSQPAPLLSDADWVSLQEICSR